MYELQKHVCYRFSPSDSESSKITKSSNSSCIGLNTVWVSRVQEVTVTCFTILKYLAGWLPLHFRLQYSVYYMMTVLPVTDLMHVWFPICIQFFHTLYLFMYMWNFSIYTTTAGSSYTKISTFAGCRVVITSERSFVSSRLWLWGIFCDIFCGW